MCDKKRGKFVRAVSTSNEIGHENETGELKGRINGHVNERKTFQEKCYFYNFYPDDNYDRANKSLKEEIFKI